MIIDGHPIGADHPPFVVAEMSANHCGSLDRAIMLISAAAQAGAHAIKLQCYHPAALAIARGGMDKRLETGPWAGRTLFEIYDEGHTPREWFPALFEQAERAGITIFSSVFDEDGVDFLASMNVPAYKISSFDMKNIPLIIKAAGTDKPVILSTGMGKMDDVKAGLCATLKCDGAAIEVRQAALLHCVSAYPCAPEDANLKRIPELQAGRDSSCVPVGFSDHTLGIECATGAVALGACIIEKHLTLARADGGLDAEFSAEPHELKALVASVTNVWKACRPPSGQAEIYKHLRVKAA